MRFLARANSSLNSRCSALEPRVAGGKRAADGLLLVSYTRTVVMVEDEEPEPPQQHMALQQHEKTPQRSKITARAIKQ